MTIDGVRFVHVLARLKPGVTPAREADLTPVIDHMREQAPASFGSQYRVGLLSFADTFPSGISDVLRALFAAMGLLLLITCANVSNLLLAHSQHRAREMAIRTSLGALRRRLIRQLLTGSAVVAILGGVFGIGVAWAGMKGILSMVPPFTIPDEADVRLNLRVLAFAGAVSMGTSILIGLRASRVQTTVWIQQTCSSRAFLWIPAGTLHLSAA